MSGERSDYRMELPVLGTTQRAMSWHHNVSLVRTSRTPLLLLSINRGTEEVGSWVYTGGINVVVFGVFAHRVGGFSVLANLKGRRQSVKFK